MPRTVIPNEEPIILPELHRWEKIAGKHHYRENGEMKVLAPGDIQIAPPDAHIDEPTRWKDLGPVVPVEIKQNHFNAPVFRKEQTKQGWFLFKDNSIKPFNDIPLTEDEVDVLINGNLESK